jgi:hypothetical protein
MRPAEGWGILERMKRAPVRVLLVACVLLATAGVSRAQSDQFWPEIDTYLKTSARSRVSLFASTTRQDGERTGAAVNPNFTYYLKPVLDKLRVFSAARPDEAKSQPLVFTAGYDYLAYPDPPNENRMILEVTSRLPLFSRLVVEDRNRGELRWIGGEFSTRYRNRLAVERTVDIHRYHPTPFARVELYWDSRYDKIDETELEAGVYLPIKKSAEVQLYYAHENVTSSAPNKQTNALGVRASVYFPWKR